MSLLEYLVDNILSTIGYLDECHARRCLYYPSWTQTPINRNITTKNKRLNVLEYIALNVGVISNTDVSLQIGRIRIQPFQRKIRLRWLE